MEDLGAYFHKLREAKGKTYKKIFEEIRLREDQVKLLEENRFFELGPYGIAKAMVYRYARYLDADVDAVMAELQVMLPEATHKEFRPQRTEKQKKIMLSTNFLWTLGIIIFVLILASILWYSYSHGWLKAPDIFQASAADTTVVEKRKPEELKPDSLRLKMRDLSQSINAAGTVKTSDQGKTDKAIQDSTDYLGNILGPSQVNVPIH